MLRTIHERCSSLLLRLHRHTVTAAQTYKGYKHTQTDDAHGKRNITYTLTCNGHLRTPICAQTHTHTQTRTKRTLTHAHARTRAHTPAPKSEEALTHTRSYTLSLTHTPAAKGEEVVPAGKTSCGCFSIAARIDMTRCATCLAFRWSVGCRLDWASLGFW